MKTTAVDSRLVLPASKRIEQVQPVQPSAVAQSIGFADSVRNRGAAFLGESEHRIPLWGVREELGVIGWIFAPHGDLVGRVVCVGRGRLWGRCESAALSFPASVLIGPVDEREGVPF